ncbi:hypothetical protein XAP412_1010032 [Xanthomonas phaseoli pv. phaseoli]|uniref:Transposase n=1 Tax=Xanthomonas campestris pv. phaseoli TaxID=317013 RepID=A0AB38DU39_XANCH|nr:hypothetical protein XAP412_1010032 [Xanthomonas phaseoli pv. phaseoli]SON75810.1 hypothetical protein XAP6984_1060004 [Xanthomonas phaseoli pv. phaseoli]SON77263.1 hypothetical protein XAP7430_1040004 [Xanthomonas phaseoli pv. phaseoli]SOO30424.1 hypothetical protein XAP6164_4330035 [Xanthomonas phaseoli pv. phaseoli]
MPHLCHRNPGVFISRLLQKRTLFSWRLKLVRRLIVGHVKSRIPSVLSQYFESSNDFFGGFLFKTLMEFQ